MKKKEQIIPKTVERFINMSQDEIINLLYHTKYLFREGRNSDCWVITVYEVSGDKIAAIDEIVRQDADPNASTMDERMKIAKSKYPGIVHISETCFSAFREINRKYWYYDNESKTGWYFLCNFGLDRNNLYDADGELIPKNKLYSSYYHVQDLQVGQAMKFTISFKDPKACNKYVANVIPVQTDEELLSFIEDERVAEWAKNADYEMYAYFMCPEIEILDKIGYNFFNFMKKNSWRQRFNAEAVSEIDAFNRLVKHGKSPKEIFACSKAVYQTLKDERDVMVWDSFRKLEKFGLLTKEDVEELYGCNFTRSDLSSVSALLKFKFNDKAKFTLNSLINYLHRVDLNEAICRDEALMLLKDYFDMCKKLEIEPRIDGDSLKREHDVTARNFRNYMSKYVNERFNDNFEFRHKFDFEDDDFLIRGVNSIDDLIDEANQQHNCVASYADLIAKSQTQVYFMRNKKCPEKSLATVELTKDCSLIRQQYLSYNRPIVDKKQIAFLDKWFTHVKAQMGTI